MSTSGIQHFRTAGFIQFMLSDLLAAKANNILQVTGNNIKSKIGAASPTDLCHAGHIKTAWHIMDCILSHDRHSNVENVYQNISP